MATLKKFWIYFIMFIAFFALTTFLTNGLMKDNYKNITNYEIKCESPKIVVSECKAARSNGYIKGNVTNDTGEHIPIKYLQIDLYDENDVYLGSEFKELKYFNVNETISFDINYKYNNINKLVIGVTDKTIQNEEKEEQKDYTIGDVKIEPIITEDTIKIAVPIGTFLVMNTALGLF